MLGVEFLAWIAASERRFDDAARSLGAADAIWRSFGATIDNFGPVFTRHSLECRAAVEAVLGPAEAHRKAEGHHKRALHRDE